MKAVARKILRVGRKLAARDRKDVKNYHLVASRDLFKPLVEALDLALVLRAHRYRNPRRTRNVGNVCNDDLSLRLLLQRRKNLVIVLRKLLERETVADVVDTNSQRHKVRRILNTTLQLQSQHIFGRRAAYAKIRQL